MKEGSIQFGKTKAIDVLGKYSFSGLVEARLECVEESWRVKKLTVNGQYYREKLW